MKLIVGLGNPGKKYLLTPHNIGWIVTDALARYLNTPWRTEKKFQSQISNTKNILLAQPLTYMNLSGTAVKSLLHYYRIPLDNLLVIHDDIDLPFLAMRFQKNRGPAGHNGLININKELNSQDYTRLRIGMASRQVLKPFTKKEHELLPEFINTTVQAVQYFVDNGLEKSANRYNSSASASTSTSASAPSSSTSTADSSSASPSPQTTSPVKNPQEQ